MSDFNWQDYEVVPEPIPENETPRQFVLRMTGRDMLELTSEGRDLTWQEVKDAGAIPHIERLVQLSTLPPRLRLKPKQEQA